MSSWLSVSDTAKYLGVSRQTIYREMKRGRLVPNGRVGRSLRFRQSYLDMYLVEGAKVGVDGVDRSTERDISNAIRDEAICEEYITWNLARGSGEIPGSSSLDRQTGKKKETGGRSEKFRRSGHSEGSVAPRTRDSKENKLQTTIRSIRMRVAEEPR